jgi:NADP-dependent 3-hydroxy acid dehydrogenase YdfG
MPPTVWFIPGASKGFAEATLRRGDKVATASLDTAPLTRLAPHYGDNLLAMRVDVTDEDAVAAALSRARERFGHVDVVLPTLQTVRS